MPDMDIRRSKSARLGRWRQMSETSTKTFDTVQMVRAIRDDISSTIIQMSAEQENQWLEARALTDPRLRQLMEWAAQRRAAADGR
jgi:hypothetical protein